jgi:ATP-dependent helicase HrpB
VLPALCEALAAGQTAVLCAPPGAGKTTIAPLALLNEQWLGGRKIILLEPRRLAARAAAGRMASLLGEETGGTVGYRMRLDNRISARTRIEVVTEGVFTRMILDDPELSDVGLVIFDEFHERSLDADFGLALALDSQSALREDLRILVMSATLDVDKVSGLLGNPPVIVSEGRAYPVEIRHEDRPAGEPIEQTVVRTIRRAIEGEAGSILAFLPGQGEITRAAEALAGTLGASVTVVPLYGNLSQKDQDLAIRPAPPGTRKVVLATSLAETSITIDGVRIVIDSGLQRIPAYEPATGMTRLETVRVSRASADQRAGRAGRTEPGIAIRSWHPGQTAALSAHTAPQILASDLSGLALDMAAWGVAEPSSLRFADQPPAAAFAEARNLLTSLEALDRQGRLTDTGKLMRKLGLPPRLSAMVARTALSQPEAVLAAAELAVLLTEQGLGGASIDIEDRLRNFRNDRSPRAQAAKGLASRIAAQVAGTMTTAQARPQPGLLLIHAFPDRIALQRGGRGRFLMANGRGAEVDTETRLAGAAMLVVADATGRAGKTRVLSAAEIKRADIEEGLPGAIISGVQVYFDEQSREVRARRATRLGAIVFDETPMPRPSGPEAAAILAEGLRKVGLQVLNFGKEASQLRDRIGFLHRSLGEPWPDMSDAALLESLEGWFIPFQNDTRGLSEVSQASLRDGLMALLPHGAARELEKLAPTHFETPAGQRHPIRYDGEEPVLTVRVQELFGLRSHPVIGGGRLPLLLELTSPAHRPIQTTRDLPGFWSGSWKDVRAEMRGRYPKHPWPEDPADAPPTHRAKPRGT